MKKTLSALSVLALTLIASCKKDDNNGGNNDDNNSSSTLTFKLNGSSWTSDEPGSYYKTAGRHTFLFMKSEGSPKESLVFDLGVSSPYLLTGTSADYIKFIRYGPGTPEVFKSDSGVVEMSGGEATGYRIESNFNARLKNGGAVLNITDGHFVHTLR